MSGLWIISYRCTKAIEFILFGSKSRLKSQSNLRISCKGTHIESKEVVKYIGAVSDQFRKKYNALQSIGYNLNVMQQSACLVINPITVDGYDALFNCTPVDRASDSMMAPT